MATTEMRARAVIEAVDRTQGVFERVADRLNRVDRAAEKLGKANRLAAFGEQAQRLGATLDRLTDKQARIEGLRTAMTRFAETRSAFREAEDRVRSLARQLAAADAPTRQLTGAYERAQRQVKAASAAFEEQKAAVIGARRALEQAGVPLDGLAQRQKAIEAQVRRTTAALREQMATQPRPASAGVTPRPSAATISGGATPIGVAGIGVGGVAGVGGGFVAKSAYDRAIAFERSINATQARGELTPEQATEMRRNARLLGAQGLGFTAQQISELQRAYVQAGFEREAGALALPTAQFSLFGDVDPFRAADFTVSALSAYRMRGTTPAETMANAQRYQDMVAKGANISRLSVEDFAQGFKFSAPLASALGVSMEQLAAMIATQGQSGMRGDEAGVAVRSMLTRMVRPTADSRQALAEMGLKFEDYAKETKPITADDLVSGLRAQGIDARGLKDKLPTIIKQAESSGADVSTELTAALIKGLNVDTVQDKNKISRFVARYVSSLGEASDVDRMFADMQAKGITPGQVSRVFDAKQGTRLMTIMLDEMYARMLHELQNNARGASARGAAVMNQGAVGAHNRLISSYDNLILSLAESGVLDTVSKGLDAVASGLRSLAETSPRLLEFGTYAAMATAALGPLALAVRGIAAAAGALGLGAAAGGAAAGAATAGAGIASGAGRMALMGRFGPYAFGAAAAVTAMEAQKGVTTPEGWRYRNNTAFDNMDSIYMQSVRAQQERQRDPEGARGRAFSRLASSETVKAEVTGEATLRNETKVTVEPSPHFLTTVRDIARQEALKIPLRQTTNGAGSTGTSSPDAR